MPNGSHHTPHEHPFHSLATFAVYQQEYQINFAESGLNYMPIAVS
jgi:hypothetical protein